MRLGILLGTLLSVSTPVAGDALTCDVTIPNESAPPGQTATPGIHGNGALWTWLWTDGTIVFRPGGPGLVLEDGSLRMKFPWSSVAGDVSVEGRRLDAPAPPLRARVQKASSPKGFYPTALIFPTEGCWEVTAHAGDASLTIVTRVVSEYPKTQ